MESLEFYRKQSSLVSFLQICAKKATTAAPHKTTDEIPKVIMDVSPTLTMEGKEELLTFVFALSMACVSDSDGLAPGKQHFDRGLLIGKIRVGKANLPVIQNIFLFVLVYYKVTANDKSITKR
jgi:hypothetical protein